MKEEIKLMRKINTAFAKYVDLLGLQNWKIILSMVDFPKGQLASVENDPNRRCANIYISRSIKESDINNVVAHELLHVLLKENSHETDQMFDHLIKNYFDLYATIKNSSEEKTVHALSKIFSEKSE